MQLTKSTGNFVQFFLHRSMASNDKHHKPTPRRRKYPEKEEDA